MSQCLVWTKSWPAQSAHCFWGTFPFSDPSQHLLLLPCLHLHCTPLDQVQTFWLCTRTPLPLSPSDFPDYSLYSSCHLSEGTKFCLVHYQDCICFSVPRAVSQTRMMFSIISNDSINEEFWCHADWFYKLCNQVWFNSCQRLLSFPFDIGSWWLTAIIPNRHQQSTDIVSLCHMQNVITSTAFI